MHASYIEVCGLQPDQIFVWPDSIDRDHTQTDLRPRSSYTHKHRDTHKEYSPELDGCPIRDNDERERYYHVFHIYDSKRTEYITTILLECFL